MTVFNGAAPVKPAEKPKRTRKPKAAPVEPVETTEEAPVEEAGASEEAATVSMEDIKPKRTRTRKKSEPTE